MVTCAESCTTQNASEATREDLKSNFPGGHAPRPPLEKSALSRGPTHAPINFGFYYFAPTWKIPA